MTIYSYSVSTDFPNGINNAQLQSEIQISTITVLIISISIIDDDVDIEFDGTLSPTELTTLNTIISNHVPLDFTDYPTKLQFLLNSNKDNATFSKISYSNYTLVTSFYFKGTIFSETLNNIKILYCGGYSVDSDYSFSIRIFDYMNKNIISEHTITDTSALIKEYNDNVFSNLPIFGTIFEIHIKVLSGDFINIHLINIV